MMLLDDYKNLIEVNAFPLRLDYAYYEVNQRLTDIKIHELIDKLNPDLRSIDTFNGKPRKKEFYAITKEVAYNILESIAMVSGTTDRLHLIENETIEVKEDATGRQVGKMLKEKGLIHNEYAFWVQSIFYDYTIYPGSYTLNTAMTSRPFRFPKPVRTCHGPGYSAGSHSLSRKNALSPRKKKHSPDRIGKTAILSPKPRIPIWNRAKALLPSGIT